ncbi:hypothetical protein ILUMI_17938, partial [Ignelater luminosus]
EAIASEFESKWQVWSCIRAVDGKHIEIKKPENSGSRYYNYKETCSIVLMAIVNANYEFIMADVGINGKVSGGEVIFNTAFWKLFANNSLNMTPPLNLPNTNETFPYVFVANDAFQ